MRKSLIVLTLLATTVFAVGYVIGQIRGVTASSAASPAANSAPAQPWAGSHPFLRGNAVNGANGTHADGTITVVNGDTVTVKPDADPSGSTEYTSVTTLTLTSSTQFATDGGQAATKASLKAGMYFRAEGTLSSDGKSLTATQVFASTAAPMHGTHAGPGAMGPHADGAVSAVNGNTITVKADSDPNGSTEYTSVTTIQLTSSTQYDAGPGQTGSKSSITVGSFIIAQGTLSSDSKTLTASRVMVRPSGAGAAGSHLFHSRPFGRWSGPSA